jgi:hypothetical protein
VQASKTLPTIPPTYKVKQSVDAEMEKLRAKKNGRTKYVKLLKGKILDAFEDVTSKQTNQEPINLLRNKRKYVACV